MDRTQKAILRKNHRFLKGNLDVKSVKDYLYEKGVLNSEDMEELKLPSTTASMKNEFLLIDVLPKKRNGFTELINALVQNGHYAHVIERLQNTEVSEEEMSAEELSGEELYEEEMSVEELGHTECDGTDERAVLKNRTNVPPKKGKKGQKRKAEDVEKPGSSKRKQKTDTTAMKQALSTRRISLKDLMLMVQPNIKRKSRYIEVRVHHISESKPTSTKKREQINRALVILMDETAVVQAMFDGDALGKAKSAKDEDKALIISNFYTKNKVIYVTQYTPMHLSCNALVVPCSIISEANALSKPSMKICDAVKTVQELQKTRVSVKGKIVKLTPMKMGSTGKGRPKQPLLALILRDGTGPNDRIGVTLWGDRDDKVAPTLLLGKSIAIENGKGDIWNNEPNINIQSTQVNIIDEAFDVPLEDY